jgi:DNA modification methylase
MGCFELAFYGWKLGAGHEFYGPNNAYDLWHVKKINPQSMEHLTAKPAELAVRAIEYSSKPNENVLDLFGGSGSSMIGCQITKRKCYMMELDPLYCDLICDRFQRFTGTPAVLERTGETPFPMKPREVNMR